MKQCPKRQTTLQNNRFARFCSSYSRIQRRLNGSSGGNRLLPECRECRHAAAKLSFLTKWTPRVLQSGLNSMSLFTWPLAVLGETHNKSRECVYGFLYRFVVVLTSSSTQQSVAEMRRYRHYKSPPIGSIPNHVKQVHTLTSFYRQDAY
jgi:hypothetical protein